MIKPGIPDNETERLAALLEYQLNGEFEEAEDRKSTRLNSSH